MCHTATSEAPRLLCHLHSLCGMVAKLVDVLRQGGVGGVEMDDLVCGVEVGVGGVGGEGVGGVEEEEDGLI